MVFVWHVRLSNELQRRIRRDTTGRPTATSSEPLSSSRQCQP